jgi:hypothetical protein
MSLDYYIYGFTEIITLSIIGFIFSIFPQILLGICIYFIRKKLKIHFFSEIIFRIILGFIMSVILLFSFPGGSKSIKDIMIYGYSVYLAMILSGLLFMIFKNRINKIKVVKCPNVA